MLPHTQAARAGARGATHLRVVTEAGRKAAAEAMEAEAARAAIVWVCWGCRCDAKEWSERESPPQRFGWHRVHTRAGGAHFFSTKTLNSATAAF